MPTRVQLPDGSIGEFPDGMKDADIEAVLQKQYGAQQSAPAPTATLNTSQPDSWLHQAENDFTQGGNRTILGRTLGTLQGRGDQGYTGIDSSVSKGAANLMGSPLRGLLHAGESAQSIPDHPVKGPLGVIGGLAESATIPSLMMGGPAAEAAIDAIPSTKHAGELFSSLEEALANHPVPLNQTLNPLQRATELGARGGTLPKAASDLLTRSQGIEPMNYPEIRDYQSNLSDLSRDAKGSMNGKMLGQIGKVNKGIYGDITSALEPVGLSDDYANAMKEFRQASQLKDMVSRGGKYAGHAIAGAAGAGGLYEAYKALK